MEKPRLIYSQILHEYALGLNFMYSKASPEVRKEAEERAILLSEALFDNIKEECREVLLYEFQRMEKENS